MKCQHTHKGFQFKGMTNATSRYGCPDCELWTAWHPPINPGMIPPGRGRLSRYVKSCGDRENKMMVEWDKLNESK